LAPNGSAVNSFSLMPNNGSVSGKATDAVTGAALTGVTVSYSGGSTTTDAAGNYTLNNLPAEVATSLMASLSAYNSSIVSLTPGAGASLSQNFSLTPAKRILFSDNFESGNLGSWTTKTNVTLCSSVVTGCPHQGSFAAETAASGVTSYARKTLPAPTNELYLRTYIYIKSQAANSVTLLQVANSANSLIAHVYIDNLHQLGIRSDIGLTTVHSTKTVSLGAWHSLEFHVKINGPAGATDVYLDGSPVAALSSSTANLGLNNVAQVWFGENQTLRSFDILYDDLVVQNLYVGP
jgi:hypothetical protein